MITEILSRKEEVESVVQVLRRRNRLSGAVESREGGLYRLRCVPYASLDWDTHNPILAPTDSMKPQACSLAFSSWDVDNFPRCFSESLTTS
jgi:hypothetical protein